MKITFIKLENVAGLLVGSDKKTLEIDFSNSKNKIISIIGRNGTGKTTLLSSLTPFASTTSLDDRSSIPYIKTGKNGYKEIHYEKNNDKYVIKHYYKPSKESHTVKSYFSLNGEELNENGNVSSFLSLVEIHFGLTPEMMRLIRLGTNVNSFITLQPAKRKEYIGKLIDEIDMYLKIHKKISEDLRVVKVLMTTNNQRLYNCHITDLIVEESKLDHIMKSITESEKERDKLISKISKIKSLINDNNIDELRRKAQEAESNLSEFNRMKQKIDEMKLTNVGVDSLITKRVNIQDNKIATQSKINSYRISIDNNLKSIERLEVNIKKITSDNDIVSLMSAIEDIRAAINNVDPMIKNFNYLGNGSEELRGVLNKLSSFNQISQMIYTLGNKPIDVYLKLKQEDRSVDKFLSDQSKRIMNQVNENDLRILFDKVFANDDIISPNCDSEFKTCPYYRLSEVITEVKTKLDEDTYDSETLHAIKVISNNIDIILNEIDMFENIGLPDKIRDDMTEKRILHRFEAKLPFFDLTDLQIYISMVRDYELFRQNIERLKQYEYQLSIYKKSGIDSHMEEIKTLKENIEFYRNNIITLQRDLEDINRQLERVDEEITVVTKYNDGKKYEKIFQSTLESTNKILVPLESASQEKMELEFALRQVTNTITSQRESHKELENKISEYKRLISEGEELSKKHKDLSLILDTVSTKKGIPVIYMKRYLGKIQQLANNLLKLIYNDALQIAKFKVTQDTFEVPYIKNGTLIPDVKYASQSEVALITMALSFALANKSSGDYNILLLDEIEGGLDETNRGAFLTMLYIQMNALNAEQVFIISQNLSQMVNVPMDCILLSEYGTKSKLQNVIYE
jgi:DNA repair exonuclease SbcCD ATPase subunit